MAALHEPVVNGSEMVSLLSALTALRQGRTGVRLPADEADAWRSRFPAIPVLPD